MEVVLSELESLSDQEQLLMVHRHRPVGLLAQLTERGFTYQFQVEREGHVELLIWKKRCTTD